MREVKDQYNVGRSLGYDYTTLLKTLSWKKDSTREVIDVNIPKKSMKAIVLLFTKNDAEDSENFPFAGLTKVNVTVEGNPNDVYSEGLAKWDMYDEARRALRFLVRVPQEVLHRQVCLCRRLPNRQRRERVRQREKTYRNTGRGTPGDRKRGNRVGSVLPRCRGRGRNINVMENKLQGVEY